MSEARLNPDARAALRFAPIAQKIMKELEDRFPEGTDLGLMILTPPTAEGRRDFIAMCTDRTMMARAAAPWLLQTLEDDR